MRPIALWLLAMAFAACGGAGDDDGGGDDDGDGCADVWTLMAGADTNATIEDGALVLSGTNLAGNDLQIRRDGLEDDFDILFTVESLDATDVGPYVAFGVTDPASGLGLAGAAVSFPFEGVSVYGLPSSASGDSQFVRTEADPIYVRFDRTGSMLGVTAGNNFESRGFVRNDLPATGPARIYVYFGSSGGAPSLTTVRISDFMVISGAGVTSDTFDCDSLIR